MSATPATIAPAPPRVGLRQRLAGWLHRIGLLPALTRLRTGLRRDLRILAYHRVCELAEPDAFGFDVELVSASPQQFREQMTLLRRRFQPLRFGDVLAALDAGRALPRNAVIVTFDDGYDDNYRVAFPILRELGVPATFFVSTGHIDSGEPYAYDWLAHLVLASRGERLCIPALALDQPLPPDAAGRRALVALVLDRLKARDAATQSAIVAELEAAEARPRAAGHADCRPMRWDQLREMHAAGMEIGSHAVTHRMLAKLDDASIERELADSWSTLRREIGAPAPVIAYPVGGYDAFDARVLAAAARTGYRLGCSYLPGTNAFPPDSPLALRRLAVERHMDGVWFAAMLGLPELFTHSPRARNA